MKNYKYYYHENTIYAVSSYAGKQVKAKAVCAKEDEYIKEVGEMLAKLRCEIKIAEKRRKKLIKESKRLDKLCCKLVKNLIESLSIEQTQICVMSKLFLT